MPQALEQPPRGLTRGFASCRVIELPPSSARRATIPLMSRAISFTPTARTWNRTLARIAPRTPGRTPTPRSTCGPRSWARSGWRSARPSITGGKFPLYVNARGLTTSAIPYGDGIFEVQFDFIDHELTIQTSWGASKTLALEPRRSPTSTPNSCQPCGRWASK